MTLRCRLMVLAVFLLGLLPGWLPGWNRIAAARGDDPVAEQRIVHKRPPLRWEDGFPLGNGQVGVMMWGGGEPLAFTLDKADLWDLRANTDYLLGLRDAAGLHGRARLAHDAIRLEQLRLARLARLDAMAL
jgi:hypothetical protein